MQTASEEVVVSAPEAAARPRPRRKRRWTMKRSPDDVNCVLRDYDAGMNAEQISARHGVSKGTLYRWIAQFEDQRTVDDDVGSMRLRIATLEKVVLHLNLELATYRPDPQEHAHAAS